MILEYDPPLKKLSDEFGPHNKLLVRALISLQNIYLRRNLDADTLRWFYDFDITTTNVKLFTNLVSLMIGKNKCLVSPPNQDICWSQQGRIQLRANIYPWIWWNDG